MTSALKKYLSELVKCCYSLAGSPFKLPEDKFQDNFDEARNMMNDEANRTRSGFQGGGMEGSSAPAGQQQGQPMGQQQPSQPGSQQFQQPGGQFMSSGVMPQQLNVHMQYGPDPAIVVHGSANAWQQGGQPRTLDAQSIRQMVPQIAHMSDEFLLGQSIDSIYRLAREEKRAEEAKSAKGLKLEAVQQF